MGDHPLPDYYPDEDGAGGGAPDNAYETAHPHPHHQRTPHQLRRGSSTDNTSPRVLSKSCDSVNKSTWRPILHQSVFQLDGGSAGGYATTRAPPTTNPEPAYFNQKFIGGYHPSTSASSAVYQTVMEPPGSDPDDVMSGGDGGAGCYQVIDPYTSSAVHGYSTTNAKSRQSIYTKPSPEMHIKTLSYAGLKPSNTGAPLQGPQGIEEEAIYAPKKSMRNAYFQTSFV